MKKPELKSGYEDRVKASYKSGVKYEDLKLDYTVDFVYTPDFSFVTKNTRRKIILETKGGNSFKYFNASYRKKWLSMYNQHKDNYDIRLLFEKDFKIGKKMRASDWCIKNGIKFYIGPGIPKEWIGE